MPTPFSHLYISQLLLEDARLPEGLQARIREQRPSFLLGGIVADQRPTGGNRATTHFYHYYKPMPDHPWREMLRQHPVLKQPRTEAHQACMLGYVAHLAADEYWARHMLKPHFAQGTWGTDMDARFFMLHLLLVTMDERDEQHLAAGIDRDLMRATPEQWLPFLSDQEIITWRDFISQQLRDNASQTLSIFGKRINTTPERMRQLLNDAPFMQAQLWQYVPQETLATIEANLYEFSHAQMVVYWQEFLQS